MIKQLARGFLAISVTGTCVLVQAQVPAKGKVAASPPLPPLPDSRAITATSAIIIEEASGAVIWSKNANFKLYPASTTKIMTALLVLENCDDNEVITAPKDVEKVTGASLHLKPGEQLSARNLVKAILLRSANDACYAAAVHISGSVEKFSDLMNQRAKALGCQDTHFNNPHGLNDKLHKTSARDLAIVGREAMKRADFREIVAQRSTIVARSINQKDVLIKSKNRYLELDSSADGIKTGWTVPAGHCYVGSATRNGMRLITAILKSKNWVEDHSKLLEWGFGNFGAKKLGSKGDSLGEPIVGGRPVRVELGADVPAVVPLTHEGDPRIEYVWSPNAAEVIQKGQRIGTAIYWFGSYKGAQAPILASESASEARHVAGTLMSLTPATLIFGVALAGGAYLFRRKSRSWSY